MSSEDETIEAPEDGGAEADEAGLFTSAGDVLRAAREDKRLSLDHVAAETRIPKRHLETIEGGHFEELPSRTYAIGFARSYARAVGLDEAKIADKVREEMGAAGPRYSTVGQGMEPGDPAKLPSRGLALFGGIAALILLLGVFSFASTYYGAGDGPGSLLSSNEASEEAAEETAVATEAVEEEAAPSPEGQVVFTALESSGWVRFYENNGDVLFEGFLEEGDTYIVPADAQDPWINTGRANQYKITIGGKPVPLLSEEMVQLQAPISAEALLARGAEG